MIKVLFVFFCIFVMVFIGYSFDKYIKEHEIIKRKEVEDHIDEEAESLKMKIDDNRVV